MQVAQELTWLQERAFDFAYDGRKRKIWLAYLLAMPLGGLGAHRFYLGRVRSASFMLLLCAAGLSLTAKLASREIAADPGGWGLAIGAVLMAAAWSWAISDLFRVPVMVDRANAAIEQDLRARIRAGQRV